MVWVSNRSSQSIKLWITVKNGVGSDHFYRVTPEVALLESWANNHWARKGVETAHVTLERSGRKFEAAVGALDVLTVYDDAYVVQPSAKGSDIKRGTVEAA
ncbi:hypothetical protein PC9H_010804 [Pleurotus ostreatus]|uniref:Uncharacterized protein n=1 Tax=Pleurotus ostreatus TaxID=5322 RepID=A0A8H6ZQ50_PLEOS|nr:uncharacterized protein PC9H_010804 [Pleurotus ostreatus]KAF7422648.1 hypothetical protein PC9H_010804 [Pleurotus ostreatus]